MEIVIKIAVLIMSIVIHEVAHGYAAFLLGDSTAKYAGRLTLNPLKHIDPWGSILIPLLLTISNAGVVFGWAKPVPYNPYNLKNQKYGPAIVGFSGPLSNILLALVAGITIRTMLIFGVYEGIALNILSTVVFVNIVLAVFNLLPIPPLDGSKLLFTFFPISDHTKMMLEQYGFIFLFAFLFIFSGVIHTLISLVLNFFTHIVVGISLLDFLQLGL